MFIALSAGTIAFAQEPPEGEMRPVRVLWWEAVPLCFEVGNVLTGFGCEIVEAVLTEAEMSYELIEVEEPAGLYDQIHARWFHEIDRASEN